MGFKGIVIPVVTVFFTLTFAAGAYCNELKELTREFMGTREIWDAAFAHRGDEERLYVGTSRGLYSSCREGRKWVAENFDIAGIRVTGIAVSGDRVSVASHEGLFVKDAVGDEWKNIPGKKSLAGVLFYGEDILTWTGEKAYIVFGDSWRDVTPAPVSGRISDAAVSGEKVYIAREGEIIFGDPITGQWDKINIVRSADGEEHSDESSFSDDDELFGAAPITKVMPSFRGGVIASTSEGIFLIDGKKRIVERVETSGIPAGRILMALYEEEGIFAATREMVFFRPHGQYFWHTIFESASFGDIRKITVNDPGGYQNRILMVITSRGIFTGDIESILMKESFVSVGCGEGIDLICQYGHGAIKRPDIFSVGPDIRKVHQMAIEYAEVSPEKIKRWRRAASLRGILPRFVFRYDENYSDKVEIYKSATRTYLVEGPRTKRDSWTATLTWDLGDLIWNPSQTSIDVRSRLMVQLRDNILEDVTRLYFERKRLIEDMAVSDPEEKVKIRSRIHRIEELTAYLDAYTGGMFTRLLD